jgi:hypothetical protein
LLVHASTFKKKYFALAARSSPLLLVVGVWCWWVVAGRLGAEWLVADELELQEQETNSWKDWQQLNREPRDVENRMLMIWRIGAAEEPVEWSW